MSLLAGLWKRILSLFGQSRQVEAKRAHCESQEMHCSSGTSITGIEMRFGRDESGDRDFYDFKPRCGDEWGGWLGMRYPSLPDVEQSDAIRCTHGRAASGVQVMRGRNERTDWDYFLLKLRCGMGVAAEWTDFVDLPNENRLFRETRSTTCKRGLAASGLRVYRGFQDWGDLDTYEFQLYCAPHAGHSQGKEEL